MLGDEELVSFGGQAWSYAEVRERSIRLASALHGLGVRPGSGVAIMSTNHPVWLEAFLACSRLGAQLVGLNYRAKEGELRGMFDQADVSVTFVEPRYVDLIRAVGDVRSTGVLVQLGDRVDELVAYEDLLSADVNGSEYLQGLAEPEAMTRAFMLFTSGTTSAPKPVVVTNRDVTAYIATFAELPDLSQPRDVSLVSAPLYHIAGLFSMLTSVYGGRKLVLLPQFERDAWLRAVGEHGVTHGFVVPTMLNQLISHPQLDTFDLSSLTRISYGAAPMPRNVIELALERLPAGIGFSNAYGQTETFGTVTVLGPDDHRIEGTPEEIVEKRRRLGSVGRATPGVRIKICAEDGSELPPGEVGEVWVGRMSADAPEPRAWTRTGDVGHLDESGYLFLAARLSDLIIRGGENIAPAEIEAVLAAHQAVDDVAVLGVPDPEWGEAIMAFVVSEDGEATSEEELIEWVRQRVATYKKPEAIRFIDAIPRTATGKTDRRELARLAAESSARSERLAGQQADRESLGEPALHRGAPRP
jgi:acyl-CoA synthetase (AMP-forming)/AMP-acid ligase II